MFLVTAFISYLFTGKADQSVVEGWADSTMIESGKETDNWLGFFGAVTSHYFIFRWFGISAFFIPAIIIFNRIQSCIQAGAPGVLLCLHFFSFCRVMA
ncbi:MAG: DNA translocase FtsK 4TM domain-containing protein [Bacteroidota bacterium]